MKTRAYVEHKGKVIKTGGKFKLIMALAINPLNHKEGVLRCITSREGNIAKTGTRDRSELYLVKGKSLTSFVIDKPLKIKNSEKIIKKLNQKNLDFIGLEDPDIFYDEKKKLFHLYFTMPYVSSNKKLNRIHMGHAVGKSLSTLTMTDPVLKVAPQIAHAKELSIAPINSKGIRLNLFESKSTHDGMNYSTVRVGVSGDMGKPWKFGKVLLDPYDAKFSWIKGDASPGPLLPKSFIDLGPNLMLGIMNGCEKKKIVNGVRVHEGNFTVGLFVYDYEKGEIKWVSPKPLIVDSKAKRITFASQFLETKSGEGILYAHVDDSFVRAYTLYADGIRKMLPKSFLD
ncbi:MAG: hypothetical protein KBC12_01395 [Candidatus Pacebacteria bacterium]|nr:hypothetical protein [Candidatus Paceibacterota bacterium]MBP9851464.1 hypothetical protein [Candidatus Paceibacterota bacterium]